MQHSTRTVKMSPICATVSRILGCMLSGAFSQDHMGDGAGGTPKWLAIGASLQRISIRTRF